MIIHSTTVTLATTCYQGSSVRRLLHDQVMHYALQLLLYLPAIRSAPMIGATGFTVAEIAVGASELSLQVMFLSFSTAAERAA